MKRKNCSIAASSNFLSKSSPYIKLCSLPYQVKGFDQIPKSLDDEDVMIQTLDMQFTEIANVFRTTAESALALQGY